MYPDDCRYSKEHEWIRVDGDQGTIGITDYAQNELGEIVYVELPEVGRQFGANDEFGTVESVKSVSDLYMPVSGEVVATNEALGDDPGALNRAPHADGWIVRVRLSAPDELDGLMSAEDYTKFVEGL